MSEEDFMTITTRDYGICEGTIEVDGETVCCDLPATRKIRGEEDSFGVEWIYMCEADADALMDAIWAEREREEQERRNTPCGSCKKVTGDVGRFRYNDEPSYEEDAWLCRDCRVRARKIEARDWCGDDRASLSDQCVCDRGCPVWDKAELNRFGQPITWEPCGHCGNDRDIEEMEYRLVLDDPDDEYSVVDEFYVCKPCKEVSA